MCSNGSKNAFKKKKSVFLGGAVVICAMVVVKNEKKLFSQDDFLFWAIFDKNLTFMSSANDF